jgi:hypothetical protein
VSIAAIAEACFARGRCREALGRADNEAMRRHLSTSLIATLLSAAYVAQEVQIRPRLVAGDEFQLELTRTREESRRPQVNHVSRTLIDVRVLSAGADGYVLDWKPGPATLEPKIEHPLLSAANQLTGGVQFRIVLGADGEFERIANQAEVVSKLQAALDLVTQRLLQGIAADEAKRMEGVLRQMSSPELLIAVATNDLQTYFSLYGAAVAVGETVEGPIEQPNPFGGPPISAIVRARVVSVSAESATLTSSTMYDREALQKMVVALAGQLTVELPAEELAKLKLVMSDETRYVFDRPTGLFSEVTNERRVSSGDLGRLDKCVIRLLRGPRR